MRVLTRVRAGALALATTTALVVPMAAADAVPTTYTVTKTADTADGTCDADCSLREAITAANGNAGQDTVMIPAGTYTLTLAGAGEDLNATGDLDVTDSVVLRGVGADAGGTFISGGGDGEGGGTTDRVFHVVDVDVAFHDLRVEDGDATGSGGGVYLDSAVATFAGARVSDNAATGNGGGLYVTESIVTMLDTTVRENHSEGSAGGIDLDYSDLVARDTAIDANRADGQAGGVAVDDSNLQVTGGSLSDNVADADDSGSGEGGAIDLSYGNAVVVDADMDDNTADEGGAIASDESQFELTRVSLDGNRAEDYGGTVDSDYSNMLIIDSPITNSGLTDDSSIYGGALYVYESQMELVRSPISDTTNTTTSGGLDGGAIAVDEGNLIRIDSPISDTTSSGMTSTTEGGALFCDASYCSESGDNSITGTSVTSTSTVEGGAVHVYESAIVFEGDEISDTTVTTTSSAYGGAVYVEYGGVELTDVTIENNLLDTSSTAEGGGVFLYSSGEGGVFRNTVFRDNTAGTSNNSGIGGAINCADDYGGCLIEDSLFEGNTATERGGAITWYEAGVTVRRSIFRNNSAVNPDDVTDDTYGGAIGSEDYGAILIEDSLIEGNMATYEGGGIYLYDAPGIIRNTIIQDNVVDDGEDDDSGYGGGISLDSSNPLILERSTIRRNSVIADGTAYGGGLYAVDGAITIRDSAIHDNTVTSRDDGDGDFAYGGGIALDDSDVPLRMLRSLVADNTVTSLDTTGSSQGGGIWSDGSVVLLENSTISGNASDAGAAVWNDDGTRLVNATIANNTADTGEGALHLEATGYGAIKSSILEGNTPASCTGDPHESRGSNVADDDSCGLTEASDDEDTDALLGPLAFAGGYTDVHMPADGSPAIDHAGAACTDITDGYEITMDQRGAGRPGGAACDAGAVEVGVGVTVTATDDAAAEDGPDEGIFTFARPDTDGELTVSYTVAGTATAGDDYAALSGAVTFPDGDATAVVQVDPVADEATEGDETVVVTVVPGTEYTVATPDTATVTIADTVPGPSTPDGVDRLAGDDRFATAANVVLDRYDPADVDTVYLATGFGFPDALAGGPLAIADDAPILLVEPTSLPSSTATALGTLAPSRVVALGGPVAVDDATLAAAGTAAGGAATDRISGPDRYATAGAIAAEVPASDTVYLAVGTNFPDALAAGPVTDGSPILLTETNTLPAATAAALAARAPARVVALGGPVAISDATLAAAATAAGGAATDRLAGNDRYATAAEIAGLAGDTDVVYVAVGTNFPDALAGGPPAAGEGASIVLVDGPVLPLPTRTYLDQLTGLRRIVILGGPVVVPPSLEADLAALLD